MKKNFRYRILPGDASPGDKRPDGTIRSFSKVAPFPEMFQTPSKSVEKEEIKRVWDGVHH